MSWWFLVTYNEDPAAMGPFDTRVGAEAQKNAWLQHNPDNEDKGQLVQNANKSFKHTLKHAVARFLDSDGVEKLRFSDGSRRVKPKDVVPGKGKGKGQN